MKFLKASIAAGAVALSAVASPAMADGWIFMGVTPEQAMYISADYRTDELGEKTVWIKTVNHHLDEGVKTGVIQLRINCRNENYVQLKAITYGSNGDVLDSETTKSYEMQYESFAPDTWGMTAYKMMCNNGSGRRVVDPLADANFIFSKLDRKYLNFRDLRFLSHKPISSAMLD